MVVSCNINNNNMMDKSHCTDNADMNVGVLDDLSCIKKAVDSKKGCYYEQASKRTIETNEYLSESCTSNFEDEDAVLDYSALLTNVEHQRIRRIRRRRSDNNGSQKSATDSTSSDDKEEKGDEGGVHNVCSSGIALNVDDDNNPATASTSFSSIHPDQNHKRNTSTTETNIIDESRRRSDGTNSTNTDDNHSCSRKTLKKDEYDGKEQHKKRYGNSNVLTKGTPMTSTPSISCFVGTSSLALLSTGTGAKTQNFTTARKITRQGSLCLSSSSDHRYPSTRSLLSSTSGNTTTTYQSSAAVPSSSSSTSSSLQNQKLVRSKNSSESLASLNSNTTKSSINTLSSNRRSNLSRRSSLTMVNTNGYNGKKNEQNRRALLLHAQQQKTGAAATTSTLSLLRKQPSQRRCSDTTNNRTSSSSSSSSGDMIHNCTAKQNEVFVSSSFAEDERPDSEQQTSITKTQANGDNASIKTKYEHTRIMEKLRVKTQEIPRDDYNAVSLSTDDPSSSSLLIDSLQSQVEKQASELQRLYDLVEKSSTIQRQDELNKGTTSSKTFQKNGSSSRNGSSNNETSSMWMTSPSQFLEKQSQLEEQICQLQLDLKEQQISHKQEQHQQEKEHKIVVSKVQQSKDDLAKELNEFKRTHCNELHKKQVESESYKKQIQHMLNDLSVLREQKHVDEVTIQSQHQLINTLRDHIDKLEKENMEHQIQLKKVLEEKENGQNASCSNISSAEMQSNTTTDSKTEALRLRLEEQKRFYETQLQKRMEAKQQQQGQQEEEDQSVSSRNSSMIGNLRQNLRRRLSLTSIVPTTTEAEKDVRTKSRSTQEEEDGTGEVPVVNLRQNLQRRLSLKSFVSSPKSDEEAAVTNNVERASEVVVNARPQLQRRLSLFSMIPVKTEKIEARKEDEEHVGSNKIESNGVSKDAAKEEDDDDDDNTYTCKCTMQQTTSNDDHHEDEEYDEDGSVTSKYSLISKAGLAAGTLWKQMASGQQPSASAPSNELQETIDNLKRQKEETENELIMHFQIQLSRQHEIYDTELSSRNRYIEHLKKQLKLNGLKPETLLNTTAKRPSSSQASSVNEDLTPSVASVNNDERQSTGIREEPNNMSTQRREVEFLSFPPKDLDFHQARRQTTLNI